jgi:hypothetical protein
MTTTTHEPNDATRRLRSHPDLTETAFHEAGHVVAALRSGLDVRSVDVVYSVDRFGAADYEYKSAPRETQALCWLAAGAAERRYSGSHHAHDAADMEQVGILFKHSHLDPEIPYRQRQPGADAERQRIVDEWYAKAEAFVEREWMWIERVAKALQSRERLTGAEVKALCSHPVVRCDPPSTVDQDVPTAAPDHALVTKTIADTGDNGGGTKYDSALFTEAYQRFLDEPKALTDADLAQLALVDPPLAERARARRAGFVEATTADERKALKLPLSRKLFLDWISDYLGPSLAMHRYKSREVAARVDALEQQIAALKTEHRDCLKALESRPTLRYAGAWRGDDGSTFVEGALITHRGGLWLAETATSGAPGALGSSGWRLVVKSGGA